MLHLNGYAVTTQKVKDDIDINVHGGITYNGECFFLKEYFAWGKLFTVGFDCAHAYDFIPGQKEFLRFNNTGDYRDLEYVCSQCEQMADQLRMLRYGSPVELKEDLEKEMERYWKEQMIKDIIQ